MNSVYGEETGTGAAQGAEPHALRRTVATDMEAIFALLPPRDAPTNPAAAAAVPPLPAKRASTARWMLLVLAIALVAAVGTLFLMSDLRQPTPAVQNRRQPAAPVATPPHPTQPALAAQARFAPPAPLDQHVETARRAPTLPAGAGAAAPPKRAPLEATPPRRRLTLSEPMPRPDSPVRCERDATAAWCLRDEVTAADGKLRDAYAAAVRAGVDRSTLVAIRRDWSHLRGRALKDPRALLRGYASLTDALNGEVQAARR
jgi:hypothetical protein